MDARLYTSPMRHQLVTAYLLLISPVFLVEAQPPGFASQSGKSDPAEVTGLFHWIHSTADADRGVAFYRAVFNMELTNSPFGTPIPGATATPLRPRAEGSSDPLVWDLTNTHGSRFRNAFMKIPGVEFGHELSEFSGIDQTTILANLWNPGATMLILNVASIDSALEALMKAGGDIVSIGGSARIANTRAVIGRDPDGYLLELIESPHPGGAIGLSVTNLEKTRRFYEDLLGFKIQTPAKFESNRREFLGLRRGEYRVSSALVPNTSIRIEFYEFRGVEAQPVRYRFQDPGAPQFQFRVSDLDRLLQESKRRNVPFVSAGQRPIQRPFGRFVFVTDPDGVFVEFVQPNN